MPLLLTMFQAILATSDLTFSCPYNEYIFEILQFMLDSKIKYYKQYLYTAYLALWLSV
jgi:hypothetical protein